MPRPLLDDSTPTPTCALRALEGARPAHRRRRRSKLVSRRDGGPFSALDAGPGALFRWLAIYVSLSGRDEPSTTWVSSSQPETITSYRDRAIREWITHGRSVKLLTYLIWAREPMGHAVYPAHSAAHPAHFRRENVNYDGSTALRHAWEITIRGTRARSGAILRRAQKLAVYKESVRRTDLISLCRTYVHRRRKTRKRRGLPLSGSRFAP